MSTENTKQANSEVTSSDAPRHAFEGNQNSARRRFLGKGAVLAPAVLTLASQPALGVTCYTPSASLSKNTSNTALTNHGSCTGTPQSPGNYKTQYVPGNGNSYSWPAAIPPSTLFHTIFSGTKYGTKTLLEVLQNGPDPQQVVKHLIGAYLNVNGGGGNKIISVPLTEAINFSTIIKNIMAAWLAHGYYEVTPGVKWYADQIKLYLTSNGLVA